MLIIAPYKAGSRSAKALKGALAEAGCPAKCLTRQAKNPGHPILNWGSSALKYTPPVDTVVINPPSEVRKLTNKLRFFQMFNKLGDVVPAWTTDPRVAETWDKAVVRHVLEGSGGEGIEIRTRGDGVTMPKAPLYTQYIGKTHEYRLHMAKKPGGKGYDPILIQRKVFKKTPERPMPDQWEVRNHTHGFVFVSDNENADPVPSKVMEVTHKIMEKELSGLHFCALDVIYNSKTKRAHVLEGNTAPGMEGNTISVYSKYIHELYKAVA